MAVYNSLTSRTDAASLIPEEVSREIIQGALEDSAVLRLARRLPDMSRDQLTMPVLTGLITAYFVTGDTGLKQTSEAAWADKYITAEELAVIVPIPEKVLADADYDVWGQIRPNARAAFGKAIDAAILHGTNAPTSWPEDIEDAASAAGNSVDLSTIEAAGGDLYDAIMGDDGSLGKVEDDGYMVTGHIGAMNLKRKLRGLRDSNGQPIFLTTMQDQIRYSLDGAPIEFPRNGAIDSAAVLLFSGDFDQLVYSIRQDITYKLLDQAVITDASGAIIYNLPQQDMVALRMVMRLGWQVPNPVNPMQPTTASRYPFATLVP